MPARGVRPRGRGSSRYGRCRRGRSWRTCQVILSVHVLDVGVVVERRVAVFRLSANLLREEVGGALHVALLEVAIAEFEVVFAAVVVLHLLGVDGAVIFQRLGVVAAGVVEVAQIEARHIGAAALWVEAQELLEAEGGVVVVELLGAYGGEVGGVGGGEVGAALAAEGYLVEDLLRGGILLLLVEVGGLRIEFALPLTGGLLLSPHRRQQRHHSE